VVAIGPITRATLGLTFILLGLLLCTQIYFVFGAWTSHEHTRTYKAHHGLNLEEAITFPLIIFSMLGHRAYTQVSFCPRTPKLGVLKFPKLGIS